MVDIEDIGKHLNAELIEEAIWKAKIEPGRKPAAVLVPFYREEGQLKILLTKRNLNLRHHSGQISFPGGGFESSDRNIRNTAIRETYEEIGIAKEDVKVMGYLDSVDSISGFKVTPFVAEIKNTDGIHIDQNEVTEVFGVPWAFLLDKKNRHRHKMRGSDGMLRKYYAFKYNGHIIWGLTAHIIVELLNRIEDR